MLKKLTLGAVLTFVMVLSSSTAMAGKYDLDLSRLFKNSPYTPNSSPHDQFRWLMGDLGAALSPRFLGPAGSLGSLGFNVALDYSMTNIAENANHWASVMTDKPGTPGEGADSYLQTIHLRVRKGLPFSAEVGGTFSKLLFSEMWGVGLEAKYSMLEGFRELPELSFRAYVSTYLGSRDFSLLSTGADFVLSKRIGIAGLFRITPYAGYNVMYVHGGSNVVVTDVTKVPGTTTGEMQETQQVFRTAHAFRHFAMLGIQSVSAFVNLGFEASINDSMQIYALRIGVDF